LEGQFDKSDFSKHETFGVDIPLSCPDVPDEVLNPKNTWSDKLAYDNKAKELASEFIKNFEKTGDVIELRPNEFFWTKKHFVKMILGLSKLYPLFKRSNFYFLAFQLQFTNLYSLWMESKVLPNNYQ